jgi:hypothetical protein
MADKGFNVVVASPRARVEAFSQMWLVEKGVLHRDDEVSAQFFTPVAISVSAKEFELLLIQSRFQITAKSGSFAGEACDRARNFLCKAAPSDFPVNGVGLNFIFVLDEEGLVDRSKRLLAPDLSIVEEFGGDGRFGLFAARTLDQFELQLEVRTGRDQQSGRGGIVATFNFHSDATDMEGALRAFTKYQVVADYAESVVQALSKHLGK